MRRQHYVSVGILHAQSIRFSLDGNYKVTEVNSAMVSRSKIYSGDFEIVSSPSGALLFEGESLEEILFEPGDDGTFWLRDVVIGVNFHWERKEDQKFKGKLKFIIDHGELCAVNIVGVEDYLTSVISSEMSAGASEELLKAHAVISRSWLLSQIEQKGRENATCLREYNKQEQCGELIKWYGRDAHKNFDVCADDHCQRYQGLTRASTIAVANAIDKTWGEVLCYRGEICDARFSKACGGVSEEFENCWEPKHHDYLTALKDAPVQEDFPNLTIEENAVRWISSEPMCFCNTNDKRILSQVLNDYDTETKHFFRWRVALSQEEITTLVNQRSGVDFGNIVDLIPIERGKSGRLVRLKIVGTRKTLIVGKELEIRRLLSPSHLYSSAFVVERYDKEGNLIKPKESALPSRFVLIGAGWGHGVGLCQIGAAVMGEEGYGYKEILQHYYRGSEIVKKY